MPKVSKKLRTTPRTTASAKRTIPTIVLGGDQPVIRNPTRGPVFSRRDPTLRQLFLKPAGPNQPMARIIGLPVARETRTLGESSRTPQWARDLPLSDGARAVAAV